MLSKLSRSHSNTTLLETDEFEGSDEDGYASTTFHGYPTISRTAGLPTSSSPPTSWQHTPRFTNRSRVGSKGSKGSLAVSIPDQASMRTRSSTSTRGIARSASESSMRSQSQYTDTDEMLKTPSTSVSVSSLAIPPLTPKDYDEPLTPLSTMRGDKNKILPPLPNPKTGSIRRPAVPGLAARFASPNGPGLRSRSNSIGTSLSSSNSSPAVSDAPPLPTSTGIPVSSSTGTLRQLQLPRYSAGASQKPVPVPGVTSPTRSPIAPTAPSSLPKPRTGTGMAYRKSANPSNPRISRIPSSPMLRSPSGTRF
ncbi:hypothetical protein V5O48_005928 [Marasmius crinis-equi]|uniref:Uncharacterized protein n=1 Tax=Marasmius crinis-equi TaxID=585013 RepID=A0ABR3FLJ7_9AGAR